jgi:phosphoribosyl 1,2-cyclic phosphate phosphodiesterase
MRPSGLLQCNGKTLLLDVGPDFRQQALKFGIDHLDGLLLTHTHFDHIAGIDELRIFYVRQKKALPCLLSKETYGDLKRRYDYLFHPVVGNGTLSAQLDFQLLEGEAGHTEFLGLPIQYVSFFQGSMKVTGFRVGDFAYISDIREYDASIFESLRGIRTLVLSSLRPESSPLHLSFAEAISFAKKTGAEQTWLTHLGHFLDHEEGNALLPPEIRIGYDGLQLEFQWKS